jgi:hypothetical protein
MRLIGHLGDTLVQGSGRLNLNELGDFNFDLDGRAIEPELLNYYVVEQQRDPYNVAWRFRLVVTDFSGQELHCGFAHTDSFENSGESVICSGHAEGLSFDTTSIRDVGTEILIIIPERHWLTVVLPVSFPPPDEKGMRRFSTQVAGAPLEFEYESSTRTLTIAVLGNETFPQTYTEGWLSEPLRMLLGQLAFPRVIVRANPDRAIVRVSQIRNWHVEADHFSLLGPAATFEDPQIIFKIYAELLTFVANARDENGNPNFDRNPLTLFYEELAQAMRGSRWIMTLTLASAVEGALKLLFPRDAFDETVNVAELQSLKRHIDDWAGHPDSTEGSIAALKGRAKRAVGYAIELTAIKRLRLLAKQKKVAAHEIRAWEKVRNTVAHGNIFSPFSSKENDELIVSLMSLFRRIAGLVALGRNPPSVGLVGLIS